MLISTAWFLHRFDKKAEIYYNHGLLSSKITTKLRYLAEWIFTWVILKLVITVSMTVYMYAEQPCDSIKDKLTVCQ